MLLPKPDVNWGNLWADLLKGASRGLLVHDGSRLSQAAIAGLEVFDEAQERRRRREREEANGGADKDALLDLSSIFSPEEWAAFVRLPLDEREAYDEELGQALRGDAPPVGHTDRPNGDAQPPIPTRPLPHRSRPMSANPIDGRHLQSIFPFGPDGALKLPTYR